VLDISNIFLYKVEAESKVEAENKLEEIVAVSYVTYALKN